MIYFRKSPNLDDLVSILSKELVSKGQQGDPFSPSYIVVQNRETQAWLQSEISRRNGISANLTFIFPSELIWHFFRKSHPSLPNDLPSDRLAIEVRIFDLLEELRVDLEKSGLSIPKNVEGKIALADSISDVFDLYQLYRPEMLINWTNKPISGKGHLAWQSYLWNKLVQDLNTDFESIPSRYEIPGLLKQYLDQKPMNLPDSIFIFGVSNWSKSFVDIIAGISKSSPIYWYDQELGSDFGHDSHLAKWAQSKLDIVQLLHSEVVEITSLVHEGIVKTHFTERISIHSCHNPEREIQVLRQELLLAFDNDKELKANDVLIMVPNLELYESYLKKEFSSSFAAYDIPLYLPSEAGISTEESILKILDFFLENEKVTDFLEILSLPIIRTGFMIDDDLLRFINKAFSEMNIHHGLLISDSNNSIEKGLNQLYLGFNLHVDGAEIYRKLAPIRINSTKEVLESTTRLSAFFRYLSSIKSSIRVELTILEWLSKLQEWVSNIDGEITESYITQLNRIMTQVSLGGSETKIKYSDFIKWIKRHQNTSSAVSTRMGTGITISSYVPYRNIPFKFVAILGFNEDVFPRKPFRPDFDLIHANPEPGDRITQIDDEQLFLERLISTNSNVHISYLGEGERKKMPSSLLTRLIDEFPSLNTNRHNLHGFSELKKTDNPFYPSIDSRLAQSLNVLKDEYDLEKSFSIENELDNNVSLNDLKLFFTHPSKYLLSNKLGVKNSFEEEDVADRETFDLDGLQKYKLRELLDELFTSNLKNSELQQYLQVSGILPKGTTSTSILEEQFDQLTELKDRLSNVLEKEPREYKVEVEIEENLLTGFVDSFYDDWRIVWKLGSNKSSQLISAWISHLVSQISVNPYSGTKLYGVSKGHVQEYRYTLVENPDKLLASLLKIFTIKELGIDHFACIPELSRVYTEHSDSESKIISNLESAWLSTEFNRGEDLDFFNRMLWKQKLPWESSKFKKHSKLIWEPILNHLEVTD